MNKKNNSAFTLIELLVIIAIIAIIALGASNLNFNAISDKQQLDIIISKIVSNFETIRNNALLGKGIGTNLQTPDYYQINFSTSGSGNITTQYYNGSLLNYTESLQVNFGSTSFNQITEVNCLDLGMNPISGEQYNSTISGTGTLIISGTGSHMQLGGDCTDVSGKILQVKIRRKNFEKTIEFNTLNGLVSTE